MAENGAAPAAVADKGGRPGVRDSAAVIIFDATCHSSARSRAAVDAAHSREQQSGGFTFLHELSVLSAVSRAPQGTLFVVLGDDNLPGELSQRTAETLRLALERCGVDADERLVVARVSSEHERGVSSTSAFDASSWARSVLSALEAQRVSASAAAAMMRVGAVALTQIIPELHEVAEFGSAHDRQGAVAQDGGVETRIPLPRTSTVALGTQLVLSVCVDPDNSLGKVVDAYAHRVTTLRDGLCEDVSVRAAAGTRPADLSARLRKRGVLDSDLLLVRQVAANSDRSEFVPFVASADARSEVVLAFQARAEECAIAANLSRVFCEAIKVQTMALQRCVLVTGGLGFIGSHVVEQVVARMPHSKVVVADKFTYAANVRNVRRVAHLRRFFLECVDLYRWESVESVVRRHRPTMVLHLAAESHVDKSFGNSLNFTRSNTVGTHVLLEACRKVGGLRRFVHMSTDEVYGAGEDVGGEGHAPETSLLLPTNPYSASKAAAEMQCHAYMRSFSLPTVIVRCNNVYGPRQFPEKAVPRFTLQLAAGRKCTLHGSGGSMRSFLHVRDAARAFCTIALAAKDGEVLNVHSPREITMLSLARMVRQALGARSPLPLSDKDEDIVTFVQDRAFNDLRYLVNGSRLHEMQWTPLINLETGLRETVEWYTSKAAEWFLPPDVHRAVSTTGHTFDKTEGTGNKARGHDTRVLLFGATGWVGPQFAEALTREGYEVVPARCRLQDTEGLWEELLRSGAGHVVNAAGITGRPNIDWCESNPLTTVQVNLEGTVTLALACSQLGLHLTNFATGCIFTYDAAAGLGEPSVTSASRTGGPPCAGARGVTEEDPPNFAGSTYSRVKAHAEKLQLSLPGVLMLRLRMPINAELHHPRNLVKKLLGYRNVISTRNSVSVLPTLLPAAVRMLQKRETGVYNFTNPGHIAPAEILRVYRDEVDADHTWREVTAAELQGMGVIVAERSNCFLDASKLQHFCWSEGLPSVPCAEDAVRQVVLEFAERSRSSSRSSA